MERLYLDLLRELLDRGDFREDRTGVGTYSLFGRQLRCDLSQGFPLLTTKKIHLKSVIYELLWFLRGETRTDWLHAHGVTIWDEWADESGELGRVYGAQWRDWRAPDGSRVDQIARLIEGLRTDPYSRRHLVVAWNPGELDAMALPPCHALFQFFVSQGRLSCQLYQRSADIFLGVPFNIASYALLTHMIAALLGLEPGDFVHTLGDVHLYANHTTQARTQLEREPRAFPRLTILRKPDRIEEFAFEDFTFQGYDPHPPIKAPVAV